MVLLALFSGTTCIVNAHFVKGQYKDSFRGWNARRDWRGHSETRTTNIFFSLVWDCALKSGLAVLSEFQPT